MFALFVELEARTVNHAQERSDEILDSGAGKWRLQLGKNL